MRVNDVINKQSVKLNDTQNKLRPGQIIQGNILKLYPNNKARIQLGTMKLTAQLEAALTIGKKYFFQVEKVDDVIHLKVLHEVAKKVGQETVKNILHQLNLPPTKANMQFVQLLLNERIPFTKEQLMNALDILKGQKSRSEVHFILKQMVANQLPMTEAVFQSLHIKAGSNFTDQLLGLLHQLEKAQHSSPLMNQLKEGIKQITDPITMDRAFINQIKQDAESSQTLLFRILKASGAINQQITFSTWKSSWEPFLNDQLSTERTYPHSFNTRFALEQINHLHKNRVVLIQEAKKILTQWGVTLKSKAHDNNMISEQQFSSLHQNIKNNIVPILTQYQQQHMLSITENKPSLYSNLLSLLQMYSNTETYKQIEHVQSVTSGQMDTNTVKDQFLALMKQVVHLTRTIPQTDTQAIDPPIKSILMQLLPHSDSLVHDRAHQLLHFINGLQIDSVQETNHFIQASLLLPGEKFSLNKDLQFEFESKKTPDGKIDPNFCRILFVLELNMIKDTIIDMSIQKRFVTVTIFNDYLTQEDVRLQSVLKKGMESLDYQMSNITVKPLHELNRPSKKTLDVTRAPDSYKGVDYRI
ncbi:hypothetical protein ACLIBG_01615 [Virgibacillus sp. W0181]|uniref:hypothetical protein n=1 Tax=Virgibacillus sp. W0181 TaxID=3391581 RepID=UPI003F490006